jgi:23S rRNA (cytidine1920-2'-O)/16S rRNA (cytidine1409-2'-O)-methyltransferase
MARRARRRFVRLIDVVGRVVGPGDGDAVELITARRVMVDGRVIDQPGARVPGTASVRILRERPLRGTEKLRVALSATGVDPAGRACLDVGAAAGGFTVALLEGGARLVYAVDTGYGQLLGSLRQDSRVVVLERTNLADLDRRTVPPAIELLTVDLSYVPLAEALLQLGRVRFAPQAAFLALVKPTFELRAARPITDASDIDKAVDLASAAAVEAGWRIDGRIASPVLGRARAPEIFLHATRMPSGDRGLT